MSGKQSDFDLIMEHGIDIRGRTIYLQGDIDKPIAHKFIKLIRYLDKTSGDITIILDSEGGDVNLGFAIYDSIKSCSNDIYVKVVGVAMSMGSIILQAGDNRSMMPHSRMMIHRGSMEIDGHFTDVERAVEENKEMDKVCANLYLEKIKEINPDFKMSQLKKMLDFDFYISAQKALELGLIDEIDGEDQE